MAVETTLFQELDGDQRRETVNTRQRADAFADARRRMDHVRGSMSFARVKGSSYLVPSYYDPTSGVRRQTSLGLRSAETEALKTAFEAGRTEAAERLAAAREAVERQAAVNRALGLGRVPELSARGSLGAASGSSRPTRSMPTKRSQASSCRAT